MSAPDRSVEVKDITLTQATLPFSTEDARRIFLVEQLVPALQKLDSGWTYLVKTDQGNKIPADIIVWTPTMEHFDVLTDSGPAWISKGVITNPAWKAGPVDSQPGPGPSPGSPAPPPTGGSDLGMILAQLNNIALQNKLTNDQLAGLRADVSLIFKLQNPPLEGSIWGKHFTITPKGTV